MGVKRLRGCVSPCGLLLVFERLALFLTGKYLMEGGVLDEVLEGVALGPYNVDFLDVGLAEVGDAVGPLAGNGDAEGAHVAEGDGVAEEELFAHTGDHLDEDGVDIALAVLGVVLGDVLGKLWERDVVGHLGSTVCLWCCFLVHWVLAERY